VIFQEFVDAEADVRVTVVDGEIFAAEIDARGTRNELDWRVDTDRADIRAVEIPADLAARLLAMMAELRLCYGAFDLRRRRDGEHVFLEVNPAGQWLFVELRTGQPISEAVARSLCRPVR
jgi:glutathione synthase/RimK-type ligase-like ATP-grasp enzyme